MASQLIDLWNLMDTSEEERRLFDHVTCNISASVDNVTTSGALALTLAMTRTCTTVSWTFHGFYEQALLDFEREKIPAGELNIQAPSKPNL